MLKMAEKKASRHVRRSASYLPIIIIFMIFLLKIPGSRPFLADISVELVLVPVASNPVINDSGLEAATTQDKWFAPSSTTPPARFIQ